MELQAVQVRGYCLSYKGMVGDCELLSRCPRLILFSPPPPPLSYLASSIASIGIRHRKIRKQCAQAHVKSTPSSSPDGSKKRKLSETDTIKTNKDLPQTPLVLKHLSIGMSSVVRALRQARSGLEEESGPRPILVVFCCKADVSPAHLIDHLPALARQAEVRIITLPKGSEESLSRALGCSRVSVIAIKVGRSRSHEEERMMNAPVILSALTHPNHNAGFSTAGGFQGH